MCAGCPGPSLTERGLEGAQSCPPRWRGHLDPGGVPPVVGDTRCLGAPGLPPAWDWGLEGGAGCSLEFLLSHAWEPLQPASFSPQSQALSFSEGCVEGARRSLWGGLGSASRHPFLTPPTPATVRGTTCRWGAVSSGHGARCPWLPACSLGDLAAPGRGPDGQLLMDSHSLALQRPRTACSRAGQVSSRR